MSLTVQKAVWQSPRHFDGFTTLVLVRLSDFADDSGGSIFPSVGTVARDCRLGERTVRKVFRDLEASGLLIKVADEQPGRYRPREYRIDLRALATAGETVTGRGRHDMPGGTSGRAARQAGEGGTSCQRGRHVVPPEPSIEPSRNDHYSVDLLGGGDGQVTATGKRRQKPKPADDIETEFRGWYAAYPKKVDPKKALAAYRRARKDATAAELLEGVQRYAEEMKAEGREPRFIKNPTSWLNAGAWANEPAREADAREISPTMQAASEIFADTPEAAARREFMKL